VRRPADDAALVSNPFENGFFEFGKVTLGAVFNE
jgi:hypothetical protein